MRIRRRLPASQAPDPCLQIQPSQHPQNVILEPTQHPPGTTPLLGLHPDVDLSLDPHPSCIPSLNPNLKQVVADKLELEEEEDKNKKKKIKKGDVDASKIRDFHVNSNNKSGGRVLSGERKAKAKAIVNTSKTSDEAVVNVSVKEEEEEEERVKKRRSPAVLMEGSRCSRVNGRGWRCCQQTLVGYSLCEHHLGKGRLRSMSSVRGQLGSTKPIKTNAQLPEDIITSSNAMTAKNNGDEDGENQENKCKKIGIVKARSISSLLG
ncbi:Growth-regulating factor protein [Dioscorea alata]|uniref:Growth-regulating factor protein n=1 Tax=Dioscorea alata TaxID=55571 RepID=A0ACB7U767_DIOAL|nr:Growth-regulating factor protein [Dioscorea alata]